MKKRLNVFISIGFSILVFSVLLGFFSFFLFSFTQAQVSGSLTSAITKNLSLGMSDAQVIILQKDLNTNQSTKVALIGPGSPGNETGFFGSLTKKAVINFQNLYSSDILLPAGLMSGNGFVGALTRAKLNSLFSSQSSSVPSSENTTGGSGASYTPSAPISSTGSPSNVVTASEQTDIYATDEKIQAIQNDLIAKINEGIANRHQPNINLADYDPNSLGKVFIQTISTQTAPPGTKIYIQASTPTLKSDVYFGPDYIVRGVSSFGGSMTVTVPPIPAGRYDLVVKSGSSVTQSKPFIVSGSGQTPLSIQSVAPARVTYGQSITITGTGFTSTGNDVVTTLGVIKNISSADGNTLVVPIAPESLRETAKIGNKTKDIPYSFQIINANGIINASTSYDITI